MECRAPRWAHSADPRHEVEQRGYDLIGAWLKRRRLLAHLTQREVERLTHIDQTVISRLENGRQYGLRWSRFAILVATLDGLDDATARPRPLGGFAWASPRRHSCSSSSAKRACSHPDTSRPPIHRRGGMPTAKPSDRSNLDLRRQPPSTPPTAHAQPTAPPIASAPAVMFSVHQARPRCCRPGDVRHDHRCCQRP